MNALTVELLLRLCTQLASALFWFWVAWPHQTHECPSEFKNPVQWPRLEDLSPPLENLCTFLCQMFLLKVLIADITGQVA